MLIGATPLLLIVLQTAMNSSQVVGTCTPHSWNADFR